MAHQKHPTIKRPALGRYARHEIAVLGTDCETIQKFAEGVIAEFGHHYRIGYMDADHQSSEDQQMSRHSDFSEKVTDKIGYFRRETKRQIHAADHVVMNDALDLLIVNGNHFEASKQIVFIDPNKEASLKKRLDQLTDVQLILKKESTEIFNFLDIESEKGIKNIQVLDDVHKEEITTWIGNYLKSIKPKVKGLVLAGGKSTRMGTDKGLLNYHGSPQREYMYKLLNSLGIETYLSVAGDFQSQATDQHLYIRDAYYEMGPLGAILSAFKQDPDSAWMVLACDLPFVDQKALSYLMEHRSSSHYATAFLNKDTGFPDPLITIYEPRIYIRMLQFMGMGYSCPRKVLINADIKLLEPVDNSWLLNVNSKEDLEKYHQGLLNQG
jgi:molybdenum cofactor guanylyltransferase